MNACMTCRVLSYHSASSAAPIPSAVAPVAPIHAGASARAPLGEDATSETNADPHALLIMFAAGA